MKAFEKNQSLAKHTAVLAHIWFMYHHLKLDEVNIEVLLHLLDIFHSLCTQAHDNIRINTSKGSVIYFHYFPPSSWRDILPPTEKTLCHCTIVLHLHIAQPFTRRHTVYGNTYREYAASYKCQNHAFHFLSHF